MLALGESVRKHRGPIGAAAARPSCMLLGGSSRFQSRRTCSPFCSAKPNRTGQARPPVWTDVAQPRAAFGDASVAQSFSQGSALKFVCNKGASPVTRRSSSNRAPFTRHHRPGSKAVAAVLATSRQANASRRKARANAHPPRRRCRKTARAKLGVPEGLRECLQRRKSYKAPARCTSMGDEPTCTSENCKTLRSTRSSLYTSPIVARERGVL